MTDMLEVPYFRDFLTFLTYAHDPGITLTTGGNISRKDIRYFSSVFVEPMELVTVIGDHSWQNRDEHDFQFLGQMRYTAQFMRFTYTRKSRLKLSKIGQVFLKERTPYEQYRALVVATWFEYAWDNFSHGNVYQGVSLMNFLQLHQIFIWRSLLHFTGAWIDVKPFAKALFSQFDLQRFLADEHYPELIQDSFTHTLQFALLRRNLAQLGLIEAEYNTARRSPEIVRFTVSELGLRVLSEVVEEMEKN